MNPADIKRALRGSRMIVAKTELSYIEQLEARRNSSIDAVEFLSRLHEWQAHAVINELTESKAVFDISIAIVEDMVKECNNDRHTEENR